MNGPTAWSVVNELSKHYPKAWFRINYSDNSLTHFLHLIAVSHKDGREALRDISHVSLGNTQSRCIQMLDAAMASAYREVCPPEITFRIGLRSPRRLQPKHESLP